MKKINFYWIWWFQWGLGSGSMPTNSKFLEFGHTFDVIRWQFHSFSLTLSYFIFTFRDNGDFWENFTWNKNCRPCQVLSVMSFQISDWLRGFRDIDEKHKMTWRQKRFAEFLLFLYCISKTAHPMKNLIGHYWEYLTSPTIFVPCEIFLEVIVSSKNELEWQHRIAFHCSSSVHYMSAAQHNTTFCESISCNSMFCKFIRYIHVPEWSFECSMRELRSRPC